MYQPSQRSSGTVLIHWHFYKNECPIKLILMTFLNFVRTLMWWSFWITVQKSPSFCFTLTPFIWLISFQTHRIMKARRKEFTWCKNHRLHFFFCAMMFFDSSALLYQFSCHFIYWYIPNSANCSPSKNLNCYKEGLVLGS